MTVYVEKARRVVTEVLKDNVLLVEPFKAGLSGAHLVKIDTPKQSYIARFVDPDYAHFADQEIAFQIIASEFGYGPQVFYTCPNYHLILMEYIDAEVPPNGHDFLCHAVDLVKRIHGGSSYPETLSVFGFIEDERPLAFTDPKKILFDMNTMIAVIQSIQNLFDSPAHYLRAPCHRDLNPWNLLFTKGRLVAIDYEAASQDDPYVDLADLALFYGQSTEDEKAILDRYWGKDVGPSEQARLRLMKAVVSVFIAQEFIKHSPENIWQSETRGLNDFPDYGTMWQEFVDEKRDIGVPQNMWDFGNALMKFVCSYIENGCEQDLRGMVE